MEQIISFFTGIWNNIIILIFSSGNSVFDILDIIIVTFIIYKVIQFMRETRAEQLMKGIFVFILVYILALVFNLKAFLWIVSMVYINAIVVLVVLFQPELRSILERMGRGSLRSLNMNLSTEHNEKTVVMIDAVCKACSSMQRSKTGALIVLERKTQLSEIASTGTIVDAVSSVDILCNVFYPKSPLHDGAVIIRDNKLHAAACILPLTQSHNVDSTLGTRHRAAIGVSEISDAIVVVVSEETGIISVVRNGNITRNYTDETLRTLLETEFVGQDEDNEEKRGLKKIFKRKEVSEDEK